MTLRSVRVEGSGSFLPCSQSRTAPSEKRKVAANCRCVMCRRWRISFVSGAGSNRASSPSVSGGLSASAHAFASISSSVILLRRFLSVRSLSGRVEPSGKTCTTLPLGSSRARTIPSSFTSARFPGRDESVGLATRRVDDRVDFVVNEAEDFAANFAIGVRVALVFEPVRIAEDTDRPHEIYPVLGQVLRRLPRIPLELHPVFMVRPGRTAVNRKLSGCSD